MLYSNLWIGRLVVKQERRMSKVKPLKQQMANEE